MPKNMRSALLVVIALIAMTGFPAFAQVAAPAASAKTVLMPHAPGGFEAGVALLLNRGDYTGQADLGVKLNALLDHLIDLNVNAISLVWPVFTGDVHSNAVFRGDGTPPDADLAFVANAVRERGFILTLRPIIDEHSLKDAAEDWRGTIRPSDVNIWFANYSALLLDYAALADLSGAHALIIGSEFNSMERYASKWRTLIGQLRGRFHGELGYSSNQGLNSRMPWNMLDFIGIDAYFELKTPEDATVEQMTAASRMWANWTRKRVAEVGQHFGKGFSKPVILTEVGSESEAGAHQKSWLWDHGTPVSLEDQRRFYAAICAAWKPSVSGIYWWDVTINPLADPSGDGSFIPLGKPAETEMANCFK